MRVHVVVEGEVQGVGFRAFVEQRARALGVAGWVRNNPDGSVELEAAGAAGAVGALRREVKAGPRFAAVVAVRDLPVSADPLPLPFEIRR
jgi:acylphosphatase